MENVFYRPVAKNFMCNCMEKVTQTVIESVPSFLSHHAKLGATPNHTYLLQSGFVFLHANFSTKNIHVDSCHDCNHYVHTCGFFNPYTLLQTTQLGLLQSQFAPLLNFSGSGSWIV